MRSLIRRAFILVLTVGAGAVSCAPRALPVAHVIGPGVVVTVDEGRPASVGKDGIVPVAVTMTNSGTTPIKVNYRDFALVASDSGRSLALLPAELADARDSARLLPEGVLRRGERASGLLYFRLPESAPTLRIDLRASNDGTISRTFLPLRWTEPRRLASVSDLKRIGER